MARKKTREEFYAEAIDYNMRMIQERDFDDVASRLGVVAYRPEYHGKGNDKNTVLFYTKEDHKKNLELERSGTMITTSQADAMKWHRMSLDGLEDQIERPYFFWFENSDINGHYDLSFGNYGKLDLRSDRRSVLFNAVKSALEQYNQKRSNNHG